MRVEINCLEVNLKTLTSDLEKLNSELQPFSSGSKKIDTIIGFNKPVENKGGLCFNQTNSESHPF